MGSPPLCKKVDMDNMGGEICFWVLGNKKQFPGARK